MTVVVLLNAHIREGSIPLLQIRWKDPSIIAQSKGYSPQRINRRGKLSDVAFAGNPDSSISTLVIY